MIDTNALKKLQQAPLEQRIQIIELLLHSVKDDLRNASNSPKPFKVRSFSLGDDISINREELYSERNL